MKSKEITELGMLLTIAFVFSYLEFRIPILVAIPGVKIGLANIITLIVLERFSGKKAFLFMVARVLLSSLVFSGMNTFLFGFAGGSLSIIVMLCLQNCPFVSILGRSMSGAVFHNVGQLIVACFLMENMHVFYYVPFLLISGCIFGFLIGYITYVLLIKLNKIFPKDHL